VRRSKSQTVDIAFIRPHPVPFARRVEPNVSLPVPRLISSSTMANRRKVVAGNVEHVRRNEPLVNVVEGPSRAGAASD